MNITDYLDKSQIAYFAAKSDIRAAAGLAFNWLAIVALFYVVYRWPNPVFVLLAVVLLGGRQLALAVIMHDCGHNSFFKSRALNRFCGQWLAAAPSFADLENYATGHIRHHRLAGTQDDPDLANYRAYPIEQQSFRRKVVRDLTGQTGFKLISFILRNAAGIFSVQKRTQALPYINILMVQVILAVLLGYFLAPWLYLLWLAALMTSHMLIVRIRQIAEHAAVPDLFDADPRNNTRTTIPRWWERMLLAPNFVNYHVEHHFMPSVPCYKLAELHAVLTASGAYRDTRIFRGYGEVLRNAIIVPA